MRDLKYALGSESHVDLVLDFSTVVFEIFSVVHILCIPTALYNL